MLKMRRTRLPLIGLTVILLASWAWCLPPNGQSRAKVIRLDPQGKDYLRVLGGPPETSTMRSGLVTLAPGKSMDKHSTEGFEELVVVLEGEGEMHIAGGDVLKLEAGCAAYCPPRTEHDVRNVGRKTLRYLYIVAEAKTR
jgi:quercetin dioxygenase-like cupin family protein